MLYNVKHASDAGKKSHVMLEPLACPGGGWLSEPQAVWKHRNPNSVVEPDPSCPGTIALEQVCTVTACGWYLLLPPHWCILLKLHAGPPVVWQDFPPHFSLALLIHLNLFLPSQRAKTLAISVASYSHIWYSFPLLQKSGLLIYLLKRCQQQRATGPWNRSTAAWRSHGEQARSLAAIHFFPL